MQILIIEDNQKVSETLRRGLAEHGYSAECCASAGQGGDAASVKPYDLILLDRMLPDGDGLEVCQKLRQSGVNTPILMLSGISATDQRVSGLNAGADDYLCKPFDFDELVARVRALLRRREGGGASRLAYADVEMDLLKRSVTRGGTLIRLRNKEFALLEFFMRRPDRVLPRVTISTHVWDMNFYLSSNVIDVYVAALRRKLDRGFEKRLIHTIIGVGYMFSQEPPGA